MYSFLQIRLEVHEVAEFDLMICPQQNLGENDFTFGFPKMFHFCMLLSFL